MTGFESKSAFSAALNLANSIDQAYNTALNCGSV